MENEKIWAIGVKGTRLYFKEFTPSGAIFDLNRRSFTKKDAERLLKEVNEDCMGMVDLEISEGVLIKD